jgi:anti-sigma factor RsiW
MTVLDFGEKTCERIRRYLDSYLSNELLVETNHEVLRHLEICPACAGELERKIQARNLLRKAAAAQIPSAGFEDRVRKAVRARAAAVPEASDWRKWSIAALVVLGLFLGGVKMRHDYLTRQAGLLEVGLRDHVHCALGGNYPATPPSLAEMAVKMGPDYVQMVPVVEK